MLAGKTRRRWGLAMKGTRGAPAKLSGQTCYLLAEVHKNLYVRSQGQAVQNRVQIATQYGGKSVAKARVC